MSRLLTVFLALVGIFFVMKYPGAIGQLIEAFINAAESAANGIKRALPGGAGA